MKKLIYTLMLLIPSISLAYNINDYDIKGEVSNSYEYKIEETLDVDSINIEVEFIEDETNELIEDILPKTTPVLE